MIKATEYSLRRNVPLQSPLAPENLPTEQQVISVASTIEAELNIEPRQCM